MTAVEWLFEQVVNRTERVYFLKELEQAKEMEKNQRQLDTNFGYIQGYNDGAEGLEPMKPELMEPELLTLKSE